MKRVILSFFLLAMSLSTFATTYTKEQLNERVRTGNYPEQWSPQTVSDEIVGFEKCKATVKNIFDSVSGSYPTSVLMDSSAAYSVKLWTNDGTVLMTCTQPDNRMKVQKSSYK